MNEHDRITQIIRAFNVEKRAYSTHNNPIWDEELAELLIKRGVRSVEEEGLIYLEGEGYCVPPQLVDEVRRVLNE